MGDLYATLGISRTATAGEIRKAFRTLVLQYHPDRNKGSAEAAQHFIYVSEAYEVLGNPDKRTVYDSMIGSAIQEVAAQEGAILYNGLYWEPRAYIEERFKAQLSALHSEQRVINAGYERHPYSNEVFSLLCDGLERKLQGPISDLFKDICLYMGEWVADKVERSEDSLRCYRGTEMKEFSLDKRLLKYRNTPARLIPFIKMSDLPDDFVEYWWSRPFSAVPCCISEQYAYFQLPPKRELQPIGRGFFSIGGLNYYQENWASRGVRSAKRISDGNEISNLV